MNLGPRCEKMLENQCQCPNTAVGGSEYCALHVTLHAAAAATAAQMPAENPSSKKDDPNGW